MKNFSQKSTSSCIESIKLIDGEMPLLSLHQERVNSTFTGLYKGNRPFILAEEISKINLPSEGLFKVRIVYGTEIAEIVVKPYKLSNHKLIKLVKADFKYPFKYEKRAELDKYLIDQSIDDVLYLKGGLLTDSWYANIALRQNGKWYTPKNYLLNGIKRQFLLKKEEIVERKIKESELQEYDAIAFINAMRDFEKVYSFKRNGDLLKLSEIVE